MRLPVAAAVLLASLPTTANAQTASLPLEWQMSTEIFTHRKQLRIYENSPVNLITGTAAGTASPPRGPQANGIWNRVDLKPWGVAANAKWAELSGILIVTHGTQPETAHINITFRAVGDNDSNCNHYIGQTIEAATGNGQRSGLTVTVPLTNGEFEWCYIRHTPGTYPSNSAYGINLVLQKWGR